MQICWILGYELLMLMALRTLARTWTLHEGKAVQHGCSIGRVSHWDLAGTIGLQFLTLGRLNDTLVLGIFQEASHRQGLLILLRGPNGIPGIRLQSFFERLALVFSKS